MAEGNDLTPSERSINDIQKNQQEFKKTFKSIIESKFPGWIDEINNKQSSILSIGFGGTATEFLPLDQEFPNAKLFGIDVGDFALTKDEVEIISEKKLNIYLKRADAGKEESYLDDTGEPIKADLVVIRSPNIGTGGNWKNVMKQAWGHLNPEGILYVTVNNDFELKRTKELLADVEIAIQEPIRNPNPHEKTVYFSEVYILIAQK